MSLKMNVLHSHSGLERDMNIPKHIVLVDEQFKGLFASDMIQPLKYCGNLYYKVPIMSFVNNGGVFKNFLQ